MYLCIYIYIYVLVLSYVLNVLCLARRDLEVRVPHQRRERVAY